MAGMLRESDQSIVASGSYCGADSRARRSTLKYILYSMHIDANYFLDGKKTVADTMLRARTLGRLLFSEIS